MRKGQALPLDKRIVNDYSELEYLAYVVAYHAAPTLMGSKPANLITFNSARKRVNLNWQTYKESFHQYFPLSFVELCSRKESTTVLFYRPDYLTDYLASPGVVAFLNEYGYISGASLEWKLTYLAQRFVKECPHEIGLFLGYPLEDVIAFAKYKGKTCLASGYWKVYSNCETALKTFEDYDSRRRQIIKLLEQGLSPLACSEVLNLKEPCLT